MLSSSQSVHIMQKQTKKQAVNYFSVYLYSLLYNKIICDILCYIRRKGKQERPASARASRPAPAMSRSYSASDLSLAGTSMLNRSGTADARPVTNSKLRKALGSARVKTAPVTPRVCGPSVTWVLLLFFFSLRFGYRPIYAALLEREKSPCYHQIIGRLNDFKEILVWKGTYKWPVYFYCISEKKSADKAVYMSLFNVIVVCWIFVLVINFWMKVGIITSEEASTDRSTDNIKVYMYINWFIVSLSTRYLVMIVLGQKRYRVKNKRN